MGNTAKVRLITLGLFLTMAFALIGSITSTVAWYAYYVRATMSFRGTSVADAEQIQVGIVAHDKGDGTYDPIEGLDVDENDSSIYWSKPGKGLTNITINSYLSAAGYATTQLSPVTSHIYNDNNEQITLYNAPVAGSYFDSTDIAPTSKYVKLPLVFRVIDVSKINSETESMYVEDQGIWITDMETSASSPDGTTSSYIHEAIRVHVDENASNRFIIKPADKEELGSQVLVPTTPKTTNVGGLLKLSKGSEWYDQEKYTKDSTTIYREHLYGFTQAEVAAMGDYDTDSHFDVETRAEETENPININGSDFFNLTDHPYDSFIAKHGTGQCFKSYTGLQLPQQKYYGFGQIKGDGSKTDDGSLLGTGKKIATTGNEAAHYLARVTLTIWLEGWDHSVIDEEIDHSFNLGIQFEIDSVR